VEEEVVGVPQVLQTRSPWAVQQVPLPGHLLTLLALEMKRV
jgi:hypothetical protein